MVKKKRRKKKKKPKKKPVLRDTKVAVESERLERLIAFLEKDRFIVPVTFLYILFLGLLRSVIETLATPLSVGNVYVFAHFISFYFCMYLFGLLIMSLLSGEKPRKVSNVFNLGFWIILLPPLIDLALRTSFVSGVYTYLPVSQYLPALTSLGFATPGYFGYGIMIEVLFIFVLAGAYIFIKTKSVVKSVLAAVIMYVFILTISTPGLYFPFPFFLGEGWAQFPFFVTAQLTHLQVFAFLWYTFLSILMCLAIAYLSHPGVAKGILLANRPLRTIHFVLLAIGGYAVARGGNILNIFSYPYYIDLAFILLAVFIVMMCWQFGTMINDIHDVEIDEMSKSERPLVRALIQKKHYLEIAATLAMVGFFSSLILASGHTFGFLFPALVLLFILVGYVYSAPPFRFRNSPFHSVAIGFASAAVFLFGFMTPYTVFAPPIGGELPVLGVGMTEPTLEGWSIALIIFVALSIAPMITDLKDYEADKKHKARSIYTVFGLETGKKVVSALIIVLFLLPLLLFTSVMDIALFVILGIVSFFGFYKYESHELVFICYFFVLIYCVTRYLGLL